MLKHIIVFIGIFSLIACVPVKESPTSTLTPTQFTSISQGTPLPPIYETIYANNIGELILIADWEKEGGLGSHIEFSSDGMYLLSGNSGNIFRAWNITDGNSVPTDQLENLDNPGLFGPTNSNSNDNELYAQLRNGDLSIYKPSVTKGEVFFYFDDALSVSFIPNSEAIAVALSEGTILFASTDVLEERFIGLDDDETNYSSSFPKSLELKLERPFQHMAFSSDGSKMLLFYKNGDVQVWETASLNLIVELHNSDLPNSRSSLPAFAISVDNNMLVIGDTKGIIRFWDIKTGKLIDLIQSPQEQIGALAFSPNGHLLASAYHKSGVVLWGILPTIEPAAAISTSTAIAKIPSTKTPFLVDLPDPTASPTSPLPTATIVYPLNWPLQSFTSSQVANAKNCKIEELAAERYPTSLAYSELADAYILDTTCDWASLAYAYLNFSEDEETVPGEAQLAYNQAISNNPAYILKLPLYYGLFNSTGPLVNAPDFTSQELAEIRITYNWSGIGEPSHVEYQIDILNPHFPATDKNITVTGEPIEHIELLNNEIEVSVIQTLGSAITDLIPVEEQFSTQVCSDNYSDWQIELTYEDGREVELKTNGSNFLFAGGPWFTEIDGQNYVQYSPDFLIAVMGLMEALELPIGQPFAWTCFPIDPLPLAYPSP